MRIKNTLKHFYSAFLTLMAIITLMRDIHHNGNTFRGIVNATPIPVQVVIKPSINEPITLSKHLLFSSNRKVEIKRMVGRGGSGITYEGILSTTPPSNTALFTQRHRYSPKSISHPPITAKNYHRNENGTWSPELYQYISVNTPDNASKNNHPHETNNKKKVAIKVFELTEQEQAAFEKSAGFPLNHERRILERLGEFQGEMYFQGHRILAMTFHEGSNILELLLNQDIATKSELMEYKKSAQLALDELHRQLIVHNDLSFSNMLFSKHQDTGEIVTHFIDFGMAVELDKNDYDHGLIQQASIMNDRLQLEDLFQELETGFF